MFIGRVDDAAGVEIFLSMVWTEKIEASVSLDDSLASAEDSSLLGLLTTGVCEPLGAFEAEVGAAPETAASACKVLAETIKN